MSISHFFPAFMNVIDLKSVHAVASKEPTIGSASDSVRIRVITAIYGHGIVSSGVEVFSEVSSDLL